MKIRLNSKDRHAILILVLVVSITITYHIRPYSERNDVTQHGLYSILSLEPSELGPSISWFPDPNVTMFCDGSYDGQTQETFDYRVWVNDSLGVDLVLFRFKWSYEEEWVNRTARLVEGDEFHGRYKGNLTWPAPGGGRFEFKVFANNTLGHWNETSPMTVFFGYLYWNPIYTPHFWILFVILPIVSVTSLVAVWRIRKKHGALQHLQLLSTRNCRLSMGSYIY